MKQILQDLKTGRAKATEVPCPVLAPGHLLIRSRRTLVSAGSERMLVDFGKAGWIERARQQPDKVQMAVDKMRTDGVLPTLEAIRNKLDQPVALGYCNVGDVIGIGAGVTGYALGDRVASNGKHAEVVTAPINLCAKVPAEVGDDAAAFTVLGAVALQGIRLAQPTLGEAFAVVGLGLVGLLTVQLLRAHGCRVLGVDFDRGRLELARGFGAEVVNLSASEDPMAAAQSFSRGRGVDGVLITAATRSSEPVHQAAGMSRKRGRIVLVGVTGLELSRADFYEKELSFQVSCSYGPGRYDPVYEEKGHDYPMAFVRWTEQRNFEAVLDMLAARSLEVDTLVSHRFAIADAPTAYELVGGAEPSLGILLEYPGEAAPRLMERTVRLAQARLDGAEPAVIGFIGAGNYARATLIPAFAASGARLRAIASAGGVSSVHAGRKFGFEQATTDAEQLMLEGENTIAVIATRHDTHARFVLAAREAGKHVFVEKPLCLTLDELDRIEAAYATPSPLLMVGFNRRFAPQVLRMKTLLAATAGPKSFIMTVNAGALPPAHWAQDFHTGGGRLIGESCHFVDLLRFLAGAPIVSHHSLLMDVPTRDSAVISLQFGDGSIGTIHYLANGAKAFPKERLEVFAAGGILQLDNFRKLRGYGWPGFGSMNLWRQDKGQAHCVRAFVDAVRSGGPAPIPLQELLEVSRVSIQTAQALQ